MDWGFEQPALPYESTIIGSYSCRMWCSFSLVLAKAGGFSGNALPPRALEQTDRALSEAPSVRNRPAGRLRIEMSRSAVAMVLLPRAHSVC